MIKNIKRRYIPLGLGLVCLVLISPAFALGQNQEPELPQFKADKSPGKLEIGIHYSGWTLNILKGMFQDKLNDKLGEEIREEISDYLRNSHSNLEQTIFEHELTLDSGGNNYGLELRFYPQGREGPFSLGLSFEKAKMRLDVNGNVKQFFNDGSVATADASGQILLNPFFTHLSFRWDLMPSWRITPYVILGLGVAAMNGELQYEYLGVYEGGDSDESLEDSYLNDIKKAEEDMDFNIPNIFPLLQASLGVRVEIMPNLNMKVGAGIWNGIIYRVGISGRF